MDFALSKSKAFLYLKHVFDHRPVTYNDQLLCTDTGRSPEQLGNTLKLSLPSYNPNPAVFSKTYFPNPNVFTLYY